MAQGAPVVTSRGTSMEEIAGDAAILVEPTDHDALAEGLAELLDDRERARTLAEAAMARAGEFTWERTAELVVGALHDAVGAGRR